MRAQGGKVALKSRVVELGRDYPGFNNSVIEVPGECPGQWVILYIRRVAELLCVGLALREGLADGWVAGSGSGGVCVCVAVVHHDRELWEKPPD